MKHRMTTKKSWEKRFSKSFTRPIIRGLSSFEKKPTIKLAHSCNSEQRLDNTDQPEHHTSIQPLADITADKLIVKQDSITSKIENIEKKVESVQKPSNIHVESESQKSDIFPEIFSDIHDLYDDAVELRKETIEVVDDIKHGRIDEVVDDLSEIVEDSREIVGETREIIKDFKYVYGVIAGLTPILVWGLSVLVFKKPK